MRRLCTWFDDKFHSEVTANLVYERVNKKISAQGYPDSARIKMGSTRIKFHLDYMDWLLGQPPLAGGQRDDTGGFYRRCASVLSGLHQ